MSGPFGSSQWMYNAGSDYEIEQSLRFAQNRSTFLSWTPTATRSSDKIGTWSFWTKKTEVIDNNEESIFQSRNANNAADFTACEVHYDDDEHSIMFNVNTTGQNACLLVTTAQYRDPSAWMHVVIAYDSTQSTASDRAKMYVNGERITAFNTETYPAQNITIRRWAEATKPLNIGANPRTANRAFYDGYIADFYYLDGQAKVASDFGETGDYGEWKPIEYSGSYGTNGFYLPFKQDYTVEGFSTVTWKASGVANQYIGGTGFQPDLTWIKDRTGGNSHHLFDAVRGVGERLRSDSTAAEDTVNSHTAFNTDGFTLGAVGTGISVSGNQHVAWNWDMGGSNATNTDGSITSTVRANPTYGQSIVSYTGNSTTGATVGHGLSSAPEMVIVKSRGSSTNWATYFYTLADTQALRLNDTAAATTENWFNNTDPTADVVELRSSSTVNSGSMIMYCFHSVTGYSKIGSYTGNGSTTGTVVTTGFAPAFVMIKVADRTDGGNGAWFMYDNTRSPYTAQNHVLAANSTSVELVDNSNVAIDFLSTGFQLKASYDEVNVNGGTYIYMAFADKREYAYWLDQSGNNNDWTSNNLTESDVMVDSPTNNFATWNPLSNRTSPTISEGNLKHGAGDSKALTGTFGVSTGKWYWEVNTLNTATYGPYLGVTSHSQENDPDTAPAHANTAGRSSYRVSGTPSIKAYTGTSVTDDSAHGLAEYGLRGFALDLDNGTLKYYVDNTLYHTDTTIPSDGTVLYPYLSHTGSGGAGWHSSVANFGQDSSFAGNKTAQGNQDGNDIGDFYYAPPTGFLALCTKNLPDVAVIPSEHFNTVLYTGTGGTQSIVTGFAPDLVWVKNRAQAHNHSLFDTLRGDYYRLVSNATDASELKSGSVALTSTGFDLSSSYTYGVNESPNAHVAWNWKANGSGSSNTTGSTNSTVSANTDAGFSIVSYTGSSGPDTIGHGLSKAPEMIIVKDRSSTQEWLVYHAKNTAAPETDYLRLDTTGATADNTFWNDTAPTSSVFSVGDSRPSNSGHGDSYIAYCFHSVDGYSKVGSYTGNGNADGTFVYTGFRPAYIVLKRTDGVEDWLVYDTARDSFNRSGNETVLRPNTSAAEQSYGDIDINSNGFKFRTTGGALNASGGTYIYLAFSEQPFKYSNAR